jgi:hypothetical protein
MGIASKKAGFNVVDARFVEHFRFEVFDKHAPTEHMLWAEIGKNEVIVIRIDTYGGTPEHGVVIFKNLLS